MSWLIFTETVANFRDELGWSIMLTGYQEGLGRAWFGEYHRGSWTAPQCREFEIGTTMRIMRFEGVSKWCIILLMTSYQEQGCLYISCQSNFRWCSLRKFFFYLSGKIIFHSNIIIQKTAIKSTAVYELMGAPWGSQQCGQWSGYPLKLLTWWLSCAKLTQVACYIERWRDPLFWVNSD